MQAYNSNSGAFTILSKIAILLGLGLAEWHLCKDIEGCLVLTAATHARTDAPCQMRYAIHTVWHARSLLSPPVHSLKAWIWLQVPYALHIVRHLRSMLFPPVHTYSSTPKIYVVSPSAYIQFNIQDLCYFPQCIHTVQHQDLCCVPPCIV